MKCICVYTYLYIRRFRISMRRRQSLDSIIVTNLSFTIFFTICLPAQYLFRLSILQIRTNNICKFKEISV